MLSPFEILGIGEDCGDEEIKDAYLQATRRWSPDRFPEQFQRIRQAYEAIATRRDRVAYKLFDHTPPSAADLKTLVLAAAQPPAVNDKQLRELLAESLDLKNFPLE